jgi:pimeloyl-ACP methyl ester carboxylesterase
MFLTVEDADLFVTSYGAGPRTFVAHGGWVGSGELWAQPFETMSRSWRTVTYDHRGTGATLHRGPITFARLVDDLFRVLDALQIERCVLAGESSGAMVVLEAVLRHPERFDGLVLVDGRSQGGRSPGGARFIEGCKADFAMTMDMFVTACINDPARLRETRWGKQIVMRSNGPAAVELMECLEDVHLEPRIGQVTQPTLILHGARDVITPLENARRLAQTIAGSRLVVFEDAGHVPTLTHPLEVAREIDDFFAATPG